MGVLSLHLRKGDCFLIEAAGVDEEKALEAVTKLIEKGEA
jgi:phosphotransferase system HPr-like phosphotransfer protein